MTQVIQGNQGNRVIRSPGYQVISAAHVTQRLETAFKDIDVGPFDVADKFFKESNAPLEKRLRHYFVDSSMTPLMVQVIDDWCGLWL